MKENMKVWHDFDECEWKVVPKCEKERNVGWGRTMQCLTSVDSLSDRNIKHNLNSQMWDRVSGDVTGKNDWQASRRNNENLMQALSVGGGKKGKQLKEIMEERKSRETIENRNSACKRTSRKHSVSSISRKMTYKSSKGIWWIERQKWTAGFIGFGFSLNRFQFPHIILAGLDIIRNLLFEFNEEFKKLEIRSGLYSGSDHIPFRMDYQCCWRVRSNC